jgi:hypothetical protein
MNSISTLSSFIFLPLAQLELGIAHVNQFPTLRGHNILRAFIFLCASSSSNEQCRHEMIIYGLAMEARKTTSSMCISV